MDLTIEATFRSLTIIAQQLQMGTVEARAFIKEGILARLNQPV